MDPNKLTLKAQEALQEAKSIAEKKHHQQIEVEHLLSGLLAQKDGIVIPILQKLGANPQVIPFADLYMALKQGVVDAQENPIPTIHVQKFYEVAKNVSLTNHIYAPIPLSLNEKRWQAMSAADQSTFVNAAQEASAWHRKAVVSEDEKMLAEMQAKGATVIKPDVPAFGKASQPVYDKAGEQYPKPVLQALLKDAEAVKAKYPVKYSR